MGASYTSLHNELSGVSHHPEASLLEKRWTKLAIPFFMAKFALLEAIERTLTNYFRAIVSLI